MACDDATAGKACFVLKLCIVQNHDISGIAHEHFVLPEVILSHIVQKI